MYIPLEDARIQEEGYKYGLHGNFWKDLCFAVFHHCQKSIPASCIWHRAVEAGQRKRAQKYTEESKKK